ncbi:MAG: hormogonium polysaccharide biosynthesis protein HpsL [Cyanobacteria bacterium P01_H01_bin.15]
MASSSASTRRPSPDELTPQELLARKKAARLARSKFVRTAAVGGALGAIFGFLTALIVSLKVGVLVTAIIPAAILSFVYPKPALWFMLAYMPFSGTVQYWVGGGSAVYSLAKDIFYIPALFGLYLECRRKNKPVLINKAILGTLFLLLFCFGLTLFLVNGVTQLSPFCADLPARFIARPDGGEPIAILCKEGIPFLQGVLGLKVLLGYIPLIFCAYYLIENRQRLFFLGRYLLILVLICGFLGLAQYSLLASGRCEGTRYAVGDDLFEPTADAKCLVGGSLTFSPSQNQIRLPGTFSSPWHWSWFLISGGTICFMVAFGDRAIFWRTVAMGGLALVLVNSLISGQRLALAVVPFNLSLLILLTGQITNLKRFVPVAVVLGLLISQAVIRNPAIVQERVDSFISRWNHTPPQAFLLSQYLWAMKEIDTPLGDGLGFATNSTRFLGPVNLFETFLPKVLYEAGWFGLVSYLIFVTSLTYATFMASRSVKDSNLKVYAASGWVYVLLLSYFPHWYPLDTDPASTYYWFFAGMVFRISAIEKEEKRQLKLEMMAPTNPDAIPQVVRRPWGPRLPGQSTAPRRVGPWGPRMPSENAE